MGHGSATSWPMLSARGETMRTAAHAITFEPKGIARLIREATDRREYRIKSPQGGIMERLVLEVLGARRAAWRVHYDMVRGGHRIRRKLKIGEATTPIASVKERWHAAVRAIEQGGDPVGDVAAQRMTDTERSVMTFGRLVAEYLIAKEQAGMRSIDEVRRILEKDCVPPLGNRSVADIHEFRSRQLSSASSIAALEG